MITYTTWDHFSFYVSLLHRLQIIPNRLHGIETFNRYNQIRLNDIKNAQRIMQHSHVNHSSTRYLHPLATPGGAGAPDGHTYVPRCRHF